MTDKIIRIKLDASGAKRNAKELDNSIKGVGKSADTTVFSVNKLAAAISSAISVAVIVKYVDAWTQLENQLKRTTNTSEELLKTSSDLLRVANDTRSPLQTTAELYTSLSVSTKTLGLSQDRVIGVTKTINNLFLESGKSAAETAGAVRQLGQALESGALRGDEFNSVAEGAPGILRAIEKQTGKTRAELRDMAADGQITADLIVRSLESFSVEAQKAADKTTRTFEQSTTVAQNNITAFIGASQLLGEAVQAAGDSLVYISENISTIGQIAGAGAAIFVARLIPAIVLAGKSTLIATGETIRYQAALASMAGISRGAAVAQTALAAATRAASGAMAFLGGPLGVIFLAATALVYFTDRASAAKQATDALSISTANLTKNEAAAAKLRVSDAIDAQSESLERLRTNVEIYSGQLKAIRDLGGENSDAYSEISRKLTETKGKYDEVSKSVNQLKDKWIELNNVQNGIQFLSPTAPTAATVNPNDIASQATSLALGLGGAVQESKPKENADQEIASARSVTESLKLELDTRRQISDAYLEASKVSDSDTYEYERALLQARLTEEKAVADQRLAEDAVRREEQRRLALDDDTLTQDERFVINAYYDEQERLQRELHQETLTSIAQKGKTQRDELDRLEWQTRMNNAAAFGHAILNLGQGQSKKIFKVGQTLALAQAAVSLPAAVLESFKNGGGYPWGLIPAGAMLATGLKNIQQIKNAGAGLGGGGGGGSIGATIGGGSSSIAPPQTTASQPAFQQKQVIEVRGINPDSLVTGQQLIDIMQTNDNVIVALTGAQADAQRRGVI